MMVFAECNKRWWIVAANAACTLLSAFGTCAIRCINAGSSGLGRAGGGHIWSFMCMTHMASTGALSASIMPKIWIEDSPSVSAWNTWLAQICCINWAPSDKDSFLPSTSNFFSCCSAFCQAFMVWYSRLLRPRSPGQLRALSSDSSVWAMCGGEAFLFEMAVAARISANRRERFKPLSCCFSVNSIRRKSENCIGNLSRTLASSRARASLSRRLADQKGESNMLETSTCCNW